MRNLSLIALLAFAVSAQAQQHGVFTEDIDRKVDACQNFFDYGNGAWRAANPIPPSMGRWSRRWAAGERSKDQLHEIVEDLSKRHDWPKGSIDQQVGDFYTSCMDQKQIDANGVKTIEPLLSQIGLIKTRADLQKMIAKFHDIEIFVPFGVTAASDNHNPDDVLARVFASDP